MSQWHPEDPRHPLPATPPQWQQGPPPSPAYWAPPRPAPARRGLPPFPRRLTRFPVKLIPRARRRRGRSHSLGYYVYLGRHPVAVMIAAMATALAWCFLAEWVAFVAIAWLMWCSLVAMGWLAVLPFAALARR